MAANSVDSGKLSPAPSSPRAVFTARAPSPRAVLTARASSPRTVRALASLLGGIGLLVLSGVAAAQDPAPPAEPPPAEPPPAEPAPAEPAPAAEAPPAVAAPPDAAVQGELPLEGDPGAAASGVAGDGETGEVVVTVDRRKKSIQKYSGTATSLSEEKLSRVGIQNMREIASQVPGLQIGIQQGNTEVYIRGVGSDNNTELGDPAVAVHMDGVYIARPRGVGSMFFDIQRVEVNSGPQGTLRGRNALGGSVNIVAKEPELGEFGANAEATFGNYSTRRYQGMLNIPLGDVVALRLAGFSEVHDPYWTNGGPIWDIPAAESADSYALRGTLKYQPTQRFTAIVSGDYIRERGTGWLGADFNGVMQARLPDPVTGQDGVGPFIPFDVNAIDNPRSSYLRGMNPWTDLWHYGVRGDLTYDLGPASIQAIGSYRSLKYTQTSGANYGAVFPGRGGIDGVDIVDDFNSDFWDSRSQAVVAELRLFAPDTARFRWTVGGFYNNEDQQVFLGQVNDPANGFGGGEFNMPDVKGGSIAAYADGTFDIVKAFRVLGGVRVTHENKSREGGLWSLYSGFPGGAVPFRFGTEGFRYAGLDRTDYNASADADIARKVELFLNGVESFGARDTLPQALCADPAEGESRLIPNPEGSGLRCRNGVNPNLGGGAFQQIPQNNKTDKTFLDWRAGVEFDAAPDNLLYFTVSTAHKAGGFNDTAPNTPADQMQTGLRYYDTKYDPESVLAFELGSKNLFLGKRLRMNASAFYYDYKDYVFQTNVSVADDPDPTDDQEPQSTALRQNAASVTVLGLDFDVNYALPLGLEAGVHVLLESAKFGDGTYVSDSRIDFGPNDDYLVDISGNWLPRASPITVNFGLSQVIFTSIGTFDWTIEGQTRAKHYMTVYNGEGKLLAPAPGEELSARAAALQALPGPALQRLTDSVPTYTRFDLGAGWKHPDGRISFSGYVNNVGNIAYATSIISTPGLNLRFFNPPRTAGVRFRVDW